VDSRQTIRARSERCLHRHRGRLLRERPGECRGVSSRSLEATARLRVAASLRPAVVFVGLLSALGVLTACTRLETGAREHFSREFSCPENRIEAKTRADLRPSTMNPFLIPSVPEPPAEVKADPARLEVWRQNKVAQRSSSANFVDGRFTVIEVSGCDHQILYCCSHPNGSRGGINMGKVACQTCFP
jgi:hypothetical protein